MARELHRSLLPFRKIPHFYRPFADAAVTWAMGEYLSGLLTCSTPPLWFKTEQKRERGSHFVLTLKKKQKRSEQYSTRRIIILISISLFFLNKQIRFLDSLFNANSHRCTRHCARKHTMQLKMCFPRVRFNMWSRRLNHQPCDWFHDWLYHQLPYTS